MALYRATLCFHVIVAILGIGLVAALPIAARLARRAGADLGKPDLLAAVLRTTQWSLALMFLTGAAMDLEVGGAYHGSGWFRASVVLLVFLGFSHARARAALRKGMAPGGAWAPALRRVERWGWTMCATVALIAILMELKP
jgi:hypothetical protein